MEEFLALSVFLPQANFTESNLEHCQFFSISKLTAIVVAFFVWATIQPDLARVTSEKIYCGFLFMKIGMEWSDVYTTSYENNHSFFTSFVWWIKHDSSLTTLFFKRRIVSLTVVWGAHDCA